jgi:hypothetical protein
MVKEKIEAPRPRGRPPVKDFVSLMKAVDVQLFVRMVTKSGLPAIQQRELINEFKRIKG